MTNGIDLLYQMSLQVLMDCFVFLSFFFFFLVSVEDVMFAPSALFLCRLSSLFFFFYVAFAFEL